MSYFFTVIVMFVVFYSIYKVIKKGKLPNNHYTPFDDMTEGKSEKDS